MLLTLRSEPSKDGATLGDLYVDGVHECVTLEDEVREKKGVAVEQWKIAGRTAIPEGKYRVVLTQSQRFKKVLPELLNVPGFSGVRIHPGNTSADTEGCILVGEEKAGNKILHSKAAFIELMALLTTVTDGGEQVWIEIERAWPFS